MKTKQKHLIPLILIIFIVYLIQLPLNSAENTLIQQPTQENSAYQSIQEAINNANHSDIILIPPGFYQENLIINKSITLQGQNKQSTHLQPANPNYPTILIQHHNVHINNITITNSSFAFYIVSDKNITNTTITQTILSNNTAAIFLGQHSHHNTIYQNTITTQGQDALYLYNSHNNSIHQNIIKNQTNYAIVLWNNSKHNIIHTNTIIHNHRGIGLKQWSTSNTINKNLLCDNTFSLHISHSFQNNISSNIFCNNTYALYLVDCSENTISNNTITHNTYGIYTLDSINNTITDDNIFLQNTYDTSERSKTFQTPGYTLWSSFISLFFILIIKKQQKTQ